MRITNRIHFRNLQGDILGGITAAIIALPMAVAFGVASGAGAVAGLWGAVLVGFFAALFGAPFLGQQSPKGGNPRQMVHRQLPIPVKPMMWLSATKQFQVGYG